MARRNGGFIGTDGLDAPDPPTGVTATAGDAQASIAFTAPTDAGTSAITSFIAQVGGIGTAGTSSPLVVTGLTNGSAATAVVRAINAYGTSAPSDASASFTPAVLQRGLFQTGASATNTIEQIQIATTANATDFGDLVGTAGNTGALGSKTRALFCNTTGSSNSNSMDFFTFATAGNGTDFGNLVESIGEMECCASATRGIIAGGNS